MIHAENYCRFTGKLSDLKIRNAEDFTWVLGRGKLFLPDPNNPRIGQYITFSAWNELAERLADVPLGSWITIICSYSLATVVDKKYPNFDLDCFVVLKNE